MRLLCEVSCVKCVAFQESYFLVISLHTFWMLVAVATFSTQQLVICEETLTKLCNLGVRFSFHHPLITFLTWYTLLATSERRPLNCKTSANVCQIRKLDCWHLGFSTAEPYLCITQSFAVVVPFKVMRNNGKLNMHIYKYDGACSTISSIRYREKPKPKK